MSIKQLFAKLLFIDQRIQKRIALHIETAFQLTRR